MLRQFYRTFTITDYLHPPMAQVRFDCGLGTNPFLDEQLLRDCLAQGLTALNSYDFAAYDILMDKLVEFWAVPGLSRDNLALGSGSFGLMRDTCGFSLGQGGVALGYAPQFARIESEVRMRLADYRYASLPGPDQTDQPVARFDLASFLRQLSEEVSLVYLDNPNNPTGQVLALQTIEQIVRQAEQVGAVVLVDEAYGDYLDPAQSAINLVAAHENLAVTRSASKFYGLPNHRVGYVFASADLIGIYRKVTDPFPFADYSANVFTALLDRAGELAPARAATLRAKVALMAALPDYAFTSPETPIMAVPLDAATLAEHGILAESCAINHVLGVGYSRIRIHHDIDDLTAELTNCFAKRRIHP